MAKDLGKLNISVTADKQSFRDAGKAAGGGTGGVGNIISGISGGGIAGGAQAMARVGGFLKLAAGIGATVAGLYLFKKIIVSVVGTLFKWSKEIDNTIKRFSGLSAEMAGMAAEMGVRGILRDVKSAGVLAGPMSMVARRGEAMRDAFRPMKDLWALVKTLFVGLVQPALSAFGGALKEVTIALLEIPNLVSNIGNFIIDAVALWMKLAISWIPGGPSGQVIDYMAMGYKSMMFGLYEEMDNSLKKILDELRRGNNESDAEVVNRYMAQVGISLTGGAWDPFGKKNP